LGTYYSNRDAGLSVRLVCESATVPTLTTTTATGVTATGAVSGGNITSDGGAAVTARGVCWGTLSTPTVSSCLGKTTDGTGEGSFSSTITGLSEGTSYYVRAYAINNVDTAYGEVVQFTTQCGNTTGGSTVTKGDNGALPRLFSVAEGKQVRFSAGNLQYTTTGSHACVDGTTKQGTWCFAANQYDYIGCGNESVSSSYTGYIDLFGWGTSGYSGCNPYLSSETNSDYGPSSSNNLMGSYVNYDWGMYNAISNGGNVAGKWRTLTNEEWIYLYNGRPNASSKHGRATVNGVHGVVFLPDSWAQPEGCSFAAGSANGWTTNNYTATQWASMETAGALFLPAAGNRSSTTVGSVGDNGGYWSSTAYGSMYAYYLYFGSSNLGTKSTLYRTYGRSVRLVCDLLPVVFTTTVSHITDTSAVVGGNITFDGGSAVTASGVCWSNTSSTPTVSSCLGKTTDGTGTGSFSSTITGLSEGTTYYVRAYATNSKGTAYGEAVQIVTTPKGALSGLFSVSATKKVHFSQGNLQYTTTGEHACADDTTKSGTWRFAEHQYDYVGSASQNGQQYNEAPGNVSGSDNANISSSYTGYIDLFGWGTSGYNGCNPYLNSTTNSDYGPLGDITGTNYDWGVYNAISNGGNVAGKWRTLTYAEWYYLRYTRTNASSKYGPATVNGVHGVVFLPDSWTTPSGCTFTAGYGNDWATNNYTTTQWEAMEGAGALFSPAAGYRCSTSVSYVGSYGNYWSSKSAGIYGADYLYFDSGSLYTSDGSRCASHSVRLVCE
ncbi:MAG: hypothetical protein KBT04_03060, partial [Bacteroidales bacterium]|nr:hypothetical protein [Candidatus Colimorpha onthohippi]